MRKFTIFLLILFPLLATSQTRHFAGEYRLDPPEKNGASGTAYIYSESDSTILFYVKVDNGGQLQQRGIVYGRAFVRNGEGIFYQEFKDAQKPCKLYFEFKNKIMEIESGADQEECGMGNNVYPDGTYIQISRHNANEYIDSSGKKQKFTDLGL